MIDPADAVLVLLAAGEAKRFGGDKLCADLGGRPLAAHAVAALAPIGFRARIAVVSTTAFDFAAAGYDVAINPDPARGLSSSLRIALQRVPLCRAILVALADMPRISITLVTRLLNEADGPAAVIAAFDGTRPSPPAVIGADHFDRMRALTGDVGARDLIRVGRRVRAAPGELADVDTRAALAALATR